MKLALTVLATCTVLIAQPLSAQIMHGGVTPSVDTIDGMIDDEVERLRDVLITSGTTTAPFSRIRRLFSARADMASANQTTCDVEGRFGEALDELVEIFDSGLVETEDVSAFHEQISDARIDETVSQLIGMGRRQLAVPGVFSQLIGAVETRSLVVAPGPSGSHFEEQLGAATSDLEEAAQRYSLTDDEWVTFSNTLIDSRLESAINRLRFNLARSGGTRRDFRRISKALRVRAQLGKNVVPDPCG